MSSDPHPMGEWFGRLPSGRPGIAGIRMTLELMLHVRMGSVEDYERLLAHVRRLSEQTGELFTDFYEGAEGDDVEYDGVRKIIRGDRAHECHHLRDAHGQWEDLLFVLNEYGAADEP